MQDWPLSIAGGLFGLIVGSFLNVVILRLPERLMHDWREQSRKFLELDTPDEESARPPGIAVEPSHCPACKHPLSPVDNIPLLSWLALRGRCRYCGVRISAQYPLVEALTAIASAIIVFHFGFTVQAAAGLAFTFALIALAGIDIRTQLLPDNLTLPLLWLGLLLSLSDIFVGSGNAILGATSGYLSLWSVYWLFKLTTGKEGMGHGDFKLLAALGAWMGGLALLPVVLISSFFGAVVGSIVLAARGQDRATPIPFGPFIAAAGWVQLVWGEKLLSLYATVFGLQ